MPPVSLDQVDLLRLSSERMRRSFALFVRRAWQYVDPAPIVWNWHLDALCTCLQAVSDGRIRELLINIPPGHAKSLIVSVLWPAWVWTRDPRWSSIFGSYELGLVTRDAVRTRTLVESEWYIRHFRSSEEGAVTWEFADDQNLKKFYKNTLGGARTGTSVGSGTGYRANALVVDDPISADDSYSEVERVKANRWFFETMSSRFNDQATAIRVVIMQRLHEEDLSGEILRRGGFQHLNLPSEFNPLERSIVRAHDGSVIWQDPRTQAGELLFPAKFSRAVLAQARKDLGPYGYAAQHDQKPTPAEGGLLKRAWFTRRYLRPGEVAREGFECVTLPTRFDMIAIVTDAAFKKTETSDRVAIGVVGRKGPKLYLLAMRWDRMSFTETLQAIRDLRAVWKPIEIAIEDKANGSAIIELLKQELPGVIPIEPDGGKEARIMAATSSLEAGDLYLPLSEPWVDPLIEEAAAFPRGRHDDGIDMLAYAINRYLTRSNLARLEALASG
jgi:predicted phage terminase large subunit-like protein